MVTTSVSRRFTTQAAMAAAAVIVAALAAAGSVWAGAEVIAPPEGAVVIDFDDLNPAPAFFNQTTALRTRYLAVGVDFSAAASDGGAILDDSSSFAVTGYSPPNFLAFNSALALQGGGHPQFPETLTFRHSIRYLQFNVADENGSTVTVEAFDKNNVSLGSNSIITATPMQTLVLEARHIAKVVITSDGTLGIIDDLAFILDSTVIDFDDLVAPQNFVQTTALSTRYTPQGVTFASPQANNGGAILNETSNFAVSGYSAPNFLAFTLAGTLQDGGKPKFPEHLLFNPPVKHVEFKIGTLGSTVNADAYDAQLVLLDHASVSTGSPMQTVVLDAPAISNVIITSAGVGAVIDDLEFVVDGTLIDFDDDINPALNFNEATALRSRYVALGVLFSAPGNDGAAILNATPGVGVTGFSGTNYLAFDAGDELANGGTPKLPEAIMFDPPVKRIDLRVTSNPGTKVFFEGRDAADQITVTSAIDGSAALQNLALYFDGTAKLTITTNGNSGAIDDLAFAPVDPCAHDACYQGDLLSQYCTACVTKICFDDFSCCSDEWDKSCALATATTCGLKCDPLCGDANDDRGITATDALIALKTAVHSASCPDIRCDFNGDGKILAVDALLILKVAVKLPAEPNCPKAAA